jgi:serine/threonine protein kinase
LLANHSPTFKETPHLPFACRHFPHTRQQKWFFLSTPIDHFLQPHARRPSRQQSFILLAEPRAFICIIMDQQRQDTINRYPIGESLESVQRVFSVVCQGWKISSSVDSLDKLSDQSNETRLPGSFTSWANFIAALYGLAWTSFDILGSLPVVDQLYTDRGDLVSRELSKIKEELETETIRPRNAMPFVKAVLKRTSDIGFWSEILDILEELFPPNSASSIQQTPWIHSASTFSKSTEYQRYLDTVIEQELGSLHVGLHDLHETFFGGMSDLEEVSKLVFQSCSKGDSPLYDRQRGVWLCPGDIVDSSWFSNAVKRVVNLAKEFWPDDAPLRLFARPLKQFEGLIEEQKLDIGMVGDSRAEYYFKYPWSRILILGQLRNNSDSDGNTRAWLDLGRYAKEVMSAHDSRRFVLGFTLFGNLMRLWMFDRLGGISSDSFDFHADGVRFVSTILGMLLMDEKQLGFDPTIIAADGKRFIEIERNGQTERLILDSVITRSHHVSGRGTTCWKAYHESNPEVPLVVKDSWMLEDARDEGEILREVTEKGVTNVARYYHHEIVHVSGMKDDVQNNVRKGLDATKAKDYSSSWHTRIDPWENRVHRRIITRDFGRPIHEAYTRTFLLAALKGCIRGHESLWKAGIIHRDISIDNLMINESRAKDSPTRPSFLIDLELAIEEQLIETSEETSQTGTRPFMAISALSGAKHSFMHDIESFFWVLFLLCIHYDGPGGAFRRVEEFDSWNTQSPTKLAMSKLGIISMEEDFLDLAKKHFTPGYQSLIPWVNKLRRLVFPGDAPSMTQRPEIYEEIYQLLWEAQEDLEKQDNSMVDILLKNYTPPHPAELRLRRAREMRLPR